MPGCRLGANRVVSHCGKTAHLFDHLVGAGEEDGQHGEAEARADNRSVTRLACPRAAPFRLALRTQLL